MIAFFAIKSSLQAQEALIPQEKVESVEKAKPQALASIDTTIVVPTVQPFPINEAFNMVQVQYIYLKLS